MSIGLATSETSVVEFHPSISLDAKARASHVLPVSEMVSTDARNGESFLSHLSESSIRSINQIAHACRRPKGTIVFFEGDTASGVYLLYEGRANVLTGNAEGKTLILKIAQPGDVLGLNAVLAGTSHAVTVQTVRPCRLAFIAREDFLKLVRGHSDACLYFAQRLARDCHSAYDVIRSMCNSVSARLARFLISCSANGHVNEGTVRVNVVLTHETIAQRIGCSRETVCRTLSEFRRRGVAELTGTTLLVHDRTALECISAS